MARRPAWWILPIAALCCLAPLEGCVPAQTNQRPLSFVTTPLHRKPLSVWFDATADWEGLSTRQGVAALLDKCVDAGVDIVIFDVKPISGYVLYPSHLAPQMKEWNGVARKPDYDLLQVACEEGHKRGLRVFAAMNFFAEGRVAPRGGTNGNATGAAESNAIPTAKNKAAVRRGTVFDSPDRRGWESVRYIPPEGAVGARLIRSEESPVSDAVFVSPADPEVVRYELAILGEICTYPIDGICLNRVRFSGITADFSPWARRSFEAYLGRTVEHWPEDIFSYRQVERPGSSRGGAARDAARQPHPAAPAHSAGYRRVDGPLYNLWLVWRARTIRDIVLKARATVNQVRPTCHFVDFTGGWYPESYREGANWASPRYDPSRDYDWAPANYQDTAYAHLLDLLYSGWYYTAVTEKEAQASGVEPWASIEGAAHVVDRVVGDACPVDAGLYLYQYKDNSALLRRVMRRAYDLSDGLMLFDASYLEKYNWWDQIKTTFPERLGK